MSLLTKCFRVMHFVVFSLMERSGHWRCCKELWKWSTRFSLWSTHWVWFTFWRFVTFGLDIEMQNVFRLSFRDWSTLPYAVFSGPFQICLSRILWENETLKVTPPITKRIRRNNWREKTKVRKLHPFTKLNWDLLVNGSTMEVRWLDLRNLEAVFPPCTMAT